MEKLLVSACLLGISCRYDGASKPCPSVIALKERYDLVPFCPEIYGGLPTPRIPSEQCAEGVFNQEGTDVTQAYAKGAKEAVALAQLLGCKKAILKQNSPSCGTKCVYDGTFSGTLKNGMGTAAEALKQAGLTLFDETETEKL